MKKLLILITFILASGITYGNHLKGGWIYYELIGPGATVNSLKYRITVKQYLDCNSTPTQIDQQVYVGIFDNATNQLTQKLTVLKSNTDIIQKNSFNPCISPVPYVCFRIDSYVDIVDLPISQSGYTLVVQRCCRIAGIVNVTGSSQIGVSYTTTIPSGKNDAAKNNSAVFAQKDTAVVCYNGSFTFDFSAFDADGDSLAYSFCNGLVGGGAGTGQSSAQPNPPTSPPYSTVPYGGGFSGGSPMGPAVNIDANTGLISGTAPSQEGDYVVAVCASEFRNGEKIGETKKEIHITVAKCSLTAAELKPTYLTCDGFVLNFQNESTSPLVSKYIWEFGDPASGNTNISNSPTPTHTYTDTGVYVLKLRVESSGGCKDSTKALVRVFPGFTADFSVAGSCFKNAFAFTDQTKTKYGVVNSWRWDFGNVDVTDDVSTKQNNTYTYPSPGQRTASLIVTNSKGCIDTATKTVDVRDVPALKLAFKDTLICSIDTLRLNAEGVGVFSWTPTNNIINPNSANPSVYPKNTSSYVVTLNDNGCITKDTVQINVLDFIQVDIGRDTSICRTDSFKMQTVSQALQYMWSPTQGLNNAATKFPVAMPLSTTKYYVTANLGKCQDRDSILVKVSPYPQANAGSDVSICYGTKTQLNATIIGSSFTWSPTGSLINSNTLRPIAGPANTTAYILSAYDTTGCPKPYKDTVVVRVIPRVNAFAGNDTTVVSNQPVQLKATGGSVYAWTPATGLNNANIPDPIATLGGEIETILYRVKVSTIEGCSAEDDIKITVFKSNPEIFVPSAFTPNADGRNDILKPIVVGMKSLSYFRVYNRWGNLIYSTNEIGKGWDGRFGGLEQQSGTYVYAAEATDYLGRKVVRKGTTVLIR